MKLTSERIKSETHWSIRHYTDLKKRIEEYENDSRNELRLKNRECKTCHYLRGGMAGQAFTNYNCKNCDEANSHPNTAVPKYCNKCSDEHSVCKRCGSKL